MLLASAMLASMWFPAEQRITATGTVERQKTLLLYIHNIFLKLV